jgi:hypothetical protein
VGSLLPGCRNVQVRTPTSKIAAAGAAAVAAGKAAAARATDAARIRTRRASAAAGDAKVHRVYKTLDVSR